MSKNTGKVDFTGQQGRDKAEGESPEGEVSDREMTVNFVKIPEGAGSKVTVYASDDIRIHEARSEVRTNT